MTPNEHLIDRIHNLDFMEMCQAVGDSSIDMILADLPYQVTQNSWDTIIPFDDLWQQFTRIIKPRGAIVLTACQPFTARLVMSNLDLFRYEWIWVKNIASGFLDANRRPMPIHESVLVFGLRRPDYYPVMTEGKPYSATWDHTSQNYSKFNAMTTVNTGTRHPTTALEFDVERGLHPTQKPVALFEYLIRTYTQEGATVFDPCVGSGTTALAAHRTNRRYICGDLSAEYVEIARKRLAEADPYKPKSLSNGATQLSLFDGDQS